MVAISRSRFASVVILASFVLDACGGQAQHDPHDVQASGGSGTSAASSGTGGASGGSSSAGGTRAHAGSANKPAGEGGGLPATSGGQAGAVMAGGSQGGAAMAGDAGSPIGGDPAEGGAGAGGEPPVINCDPIVFEDPELEATVRAELQRPSGALTAKDAGALEFLVTPSITSLKGVECLTGLRSLDIGSLPPGKVTDLSPLARLTKLEDISVMRNPIASLEPLGKLPKLTQIYMSLIPVELDLTPLASAPKLDYLDIEHDSIKSLAPLGSVTTLRTIKFRNGQLADPSGVAELHSVEDLDATAVFSDAAPLAGLSNLKRLRIGQKPLNNFSSLKGLVNLALLDVSGTGITDLGPVANMPKLIDIYAQQNNITDPSPLSGLTQLNIVDLIANQLTDLSPLAANDALATGDFVYAAQNQLACAEQSANIQALRNRRVSVSSD